MSNYLVVFLRLLTSMQIRNQAEFYQVALNASLMITISSSVFSLTQFLELFSKSRVIKLHQDLFLWPVELYG